MGHILQTVCCCALGTLGLLVLVRGGLQFREGLASCAWPSVPGHVISSELKRHEGRAKGYSVEVEFSYVIGGAPLRSRRVRATEHIQSQPEAAKQLQRYRPGGEVAVFYNPVTPSIAFLEPGIEPWELMIPASGLLITSGSGFALWKLRRERRKVRQRAVAIAVKLT